MPTLEWIGKDKVINHHQKVPYRVLDKKYTYNADESENKIIRGDNLEALKALLPQYEGKIKCIYIDPPYNTGNEKWIYNDNVNDPKMKKWLGEVVGKEGEDLSRHDKWLCMMYPRLKLLQKLLADDGAIFISIDDNEQANLKLICDEVFGANNFVEQMIWQKRTSPDSRKTVSCGHEYIVAYVKNKNNIAHVFNLQPLSEKDKKGYTNPDNDIRGPWRSTDFGAQGYRPNQMYKIVTPGGAEYVPSDGRCWKNIEANYKELLLDGRMWFGSDGKGVPRKKVYLSEKLGKNTWTWWSNEEVGHTQEATQLITEIFGSKTVFDYPKPIRLINRILQISTNTNSIILDSFAGSGTTAHAVLNMNKSDGGNRKFILVEMEDYAETITAERVRRVIDGYGDTKGTGGDFTFYDLGEPLLIDNQYINEKVDVSIIREYVWFTETKKPFVPVTNDDNEYFLGINNDNAYYFYYEKEEITTLNVDFLPNVKTKADSYIIYADKCSFSDEELSKMNITFKKIPRDISRL